MASFAYEAINTAGEFVNGKIEAEEESFASQQLQKNGFTVVEIKKEKSSSPLSFNFSLGQKPVPVGEMSLFSRQLATMLDAGIPVTRSLNTLSNQVGHPGLAKTLSAVASDVEQGSSLTEAVEKHPKVFTRLFIGMVNSGETGGSLQKSLQLLSEQLQKDKALRDNIKSATFYPLVISGFAVILFLAMLLFLVPVFEGFYPADIELPAITGFIFSVSGSLRESWATWIIVVLGIYLGTKFFFRTSFMQRYMNRISFRIPAFGPLVKKSVLARFARTLSTMTTGGIPVMQAIDSAGKATGSVVIEESIAEVTEKIKEGKFIAESLEETGVFPPMMTHMVSVGEETGSLPDLLDRIATFFEEEVETLSKGLSSLIEPLMFVAIGVLVGFMLISLYLPIFTVIVELG